MIYTTKMHKNSWMPALRRGLGEMLNGTHLGDWELLEATWTCFFHEEA